MKNKGISGKEMEVISYLELEGKRFFIRSDARSFFKNVNEMNVYLSKLKRKGRIVKLNKTKYYLVPIKAYQGHWSEHPFIIIDEIFNGRDYFIGGKAAAYYWGYIEQIPNEIFVYSTKRQGKKKYFGFSVRFVRTTEKNMKDFVKKNVKNHQFIVAGRKRSLQWK